METKVPGIAIAVVDRDGVTATAAVGQRRIDETAPLLSSDEFHLGSDTKAMTAFLVARFVERGLLRWDTTLAEAFPALRASMNDAYAGVRLMDVLRHRGGMPAFTSAADMSLLDGIDSASALVVQRAAFARNVLRRTPTIAPGTRFFYSNAGYVVIGAALEQRVGKPWEDLMREEIFSPLRMTSCGFGPPARGQARGQPFGHRLKGSTDDTYVPTDDDNPPVLGPAGTVHCSLSDWATFVRANMNVPAVRLVKPETLAVLHLALPIEESTSEDKRAYAMGWGSAERPWAAGQVLAHDGSNGNNLAAARVAVGRGIAFLIAVNAGDERADHAVKLAYDALTARYASHIPR